MTVTRTLSIELSPNGSDATNSKIKFFRSPASKSGATNDITLDSCSKSTLSPENCVHENVNGSPSGSHPEPVIVTGVFSITV